MNWVHLLARLKRLLSTGHDPVDRRAHSRMAVDMPVTVIITYENTPREARIINVGVGGLALESNIEFMVGDRVQLMMPQASDDQRFMVQTVWRQRKKKGSDVYLSGMKFVVDTLQRKRTVAKFLLEDCKLGSLQPQERRKYLRVYIPQELTAHLVVKNGPKWDVRVLDLAMGGALLHCPQAVASGTQIGIRLNVEAGEPTIDCVGRVVRSVARDKDWEVGMAFEHVGSGHAARLKAFLVRTLSAGSSL
jgi:c-di-GMP-binding flagellar brake protein YcgR